jgi:type IV pilus assembly protein PilM
MWNETVTLYIDDTSVRMLILNGQRVKKWAEMQLEPGLVKGGVVTTEGEVAGRIKQLFKNHDVHARRVMLGLSGLHSLTRPASLPLLPRNMLPEAVAREARRVLPVPLDQLYLTWRLVPSSKGKIQVFLAAIPRKTADSMISMLKIAGLVPSHMILKPLALSKTVPVNTAILIDVQPDEFDIVILSEGIAHPIRSVTFPNTELNWDKKLEMITSDVDRTIKFFDANSQDKPIRSEVQVYVSGAVLSKPELQTSLMNSIGRQIVPLAPVYKGAEQMDLSRFITNIAMSVRTPPAARESTFAIANLNVLPPAYQPKPISSAKLIGIPAGAAVVGLLVPILMMMQNASANILTLQSQVDQANQLNSEKMAQRTELNRSVTDLQKKSDTAKETYQNLKVALDVLITDQEIVNGDLRLTLDLVPQSVTITSISESGGTLSIKGSAPTEADVLGFARDLDLSKRFNQTTVASLQETASSKDQTTNVQFTLSLQRKG